MPGCKSREGGQKEKKCERQRNELTLQCDKHGRGKSRCCAGRQDNEEKKKMARGKGIPMGKKTVSYTQNAKREKKIKFSKWHSGSRRGQRKAKLFLRGEIQRT